MSLKQAHRGPYAGRQFWGCDDYPRCRGLVNLTDPDDLPDESHQETESATDTSSNIPAVSQNDSDALISIDEAYSDVLGQYVSSNDVSIKVSMALDLKLGFDPSSEMNPTTRRPKLVRKCQNLGAENVVKALHEGIVTAREYSFYEEIGSLVIMLEDDVEFISSRFFRSATRDRPSQRY